jgi:hydrogenase maturation factor HypF (carbamoyltransferase family)
MSFTLDRTSIDEWVVDDPKLRVRQHKLRQNRLNQQRLDYNKLILKQKLSIRRERVRQKQLRKQNLVDIDVCEICHRTHNSMTPLQHRIPFKECVDCGEQHGSRGCEVIEIC